MNLLFLTKCLKDPTCAIFSKIKGFKEKNMTLPCIKCSPSQLVPQFDKAHQGPLDATFYRELCAAHKTDISFNTYERKGNTKEGFTFNTIAFNTTEVGCGWG